MAVSITVVVLAVSQTAPSASASRPPSLVIVGDSLSTGFCTSPDAAWPHLLAEQTRGRLNVVNASENGAGYLTGGDNNGTFGSNAVAAVTPDTQTVVFFGSENDMGGSTSDLTGAAVSALRSAQATAPGARLIVVGPTAFTGQPEPDRLAVRDALKAAAAQTHSRFVDPLAQNWLASPQYMGPDGDHPTVAGQQQLLKEMMRVLGL